MISIKRTTRSHLVITSHECNFSSILGLCKLIDTWCCDRFKSLKLNSLFLTDSNPWSILNLDVSSLGYFLEHHTALNMCGNPHNSTSKGALRQFSVHATHFSSTKTLIIWQCYRLFFHIRNGYATQQHCKLQDVIQRTLNLCNISIMVLTSVHLDNKS